MTYLILREYGCVGAVLVADLFGDREALPFPTREMATNWADEHFNGESWRVIPVHKLGEPITDNDRCS